MFCCFQYFLDLEFDEKEVLENFCSALTVLACAIFQVIIISNIDFLVESMTKNMLLLSIPQYFLAVSEVSKNFANTLSQYL